MFSPQSHKEPKEEFCLFIAINLSINCKQSQKESQICPGLSRGLLILQAQQSCHNPTNMLIIIEYSFKSMSLLLDINDKSIKSGGFEKRSLK
jgi:hypothetical protein